MVLGFICFKFLVLFCFLEYIKKFDFLQVLMGNFVCIHVSVKFWINSECVTVCLFYLNKLWFHIFHGFCILGGVPIHILWLCDLFAFSTDGKNFEFKIVSRNLTSAWNLMIFIGQIFVMIFLHFMRFLNDFLYLTWNMVNLVIHALVLVLKVHFLRFDL